jgi:hypothetical protein
MGETQIHVQLHQKRDYQFEVRFGSGIPDILGDEPAPLGSGLGPSPVQLLAAAVGNSSRSQSLFRVMSTPRWGATPKGGCACSKSGQY